MTVIRLEWVHAAAAHARWREEAHLLKEELRRIPISLGVKSELYRELSEGPLDNLLPVGREGYRALGRRKAYDYDRLVSEAKLDFESMENPDARREKDSQTWW